jgi:tripartite motif-containing protein 71
VKFFKPYLLFAFWLTAAFLGVVIPIACTNTSSYFNPTTPSTTVVASATPTNLFGFTSTPTFAISPTATPTNTPVVTPITGTPICTPNAPNGLAVNSAGTSIFVAGGDGNLSIYPITGGTASTMINNFNNSVIFGSLTAVVVDSSGNYYVIDSGSNAVYEWNSTGVTVATWNNFNGQTFNSPQGIAVVGSSTPTVYVVDTGNHVVDEFSMGLTGPVPIRQIGYPGGGGSGNFNNPTGIAIGTGGVTIYVADMDDDLIQEFVSGSFVGQFSTPPESINNAPGIMGIAVNPGGNVFTADYNNSYIDDYNSTSSPVTFISQWGGPSFDTNPFSPTGVALNSAGTTLYVTDYDNNAIYSVAP